MNTFKCQTCYLKKQRLGTFLNPTYAVYAVIRFMCTWSHQYPSIPQYKFSKIVSFGEKLKLNAVKVF
jgi:hypothetical protein